MKTFTAFIFTVLSLSIFSFQVAAESPLSYADQMRPMEIYKSPTCGCCTGWVEHMESANFATKVIHPSNLDAFKDTIGISHKYRSCHTALKAGFYFEGHIPADVVTHFLNEPHESVSGLAVPGMPMGSPGMDVPGKYRPYTVYKIMSDNSSVPYAKVSYDGIEYLD